MIYSMRFISIGKPAVLKQDPVVQTIIDTIRRFVREERMNIYAYCLMPDHLHIVASPRQSSSISKLMQDFKVATCMAGCDCGIYESIWGRVFYMPIRDDLGALKDICRFVASNPVRSGLVSDLNQWPHVWVNQSLMAG